MEFDYIRAYSVKNIINETGIMEVKNDEFVTALAKQLPKAEGYGILRICDRAIFFKVKDKKTATVVSEYLNARKIELTQTANKLMEGMKLINRELNNPLLKGVQDTEPIEEP